MYALKPDMTLGATNPRAYIVVTENFHDEIPLAVQELLEETAIGLNLQSSHLSHPAKISLNRAITRVDQYQHQLTDLKILVVSGKSTNFLRLVTSALWNYHSANTQCPVIVLGVLSAPARSAWDISSIVSSIPRTEPPASWETHALVRPLFRAHNLFAKHVCPDMQNAMARAYYSVLAVTSYLTMGMGSVECLDCPCLLQGKLNLSPWEVKAEHHQPYACGISSRILPGPQVRLLRILSLTQFRSVDLCQHRKQHQRPGKCCQDLQTVSSKIAKSEMDTATQLSDHLWDELVGTIQQHQSP